jgi:hypothetical protein
MRFDTLNARSLNRSHSLATITREIAECKLDLVGVEGVSQMGRGGTGPSGDYTYFYGSGNRNYELRTGICVRSTIISEIKRVEFVNDRMSYIIRVPRGCWCGIMFCMFMHQQRIKLMIRRTASMMN